MNDRNSKTASGGIGFTGLLTIVFIVLKLIGVIKWSWWWVLSPALIGIALAILLFVIGIVLTIIVDKY